MTGIRYCKKNNQGRLLCILLIVTQQPIVKAREVAKTYLDERHIPYNDISESFDTTLTILFKDDADEKEFCDFVSYVNEAMGEEVDWYQVD